MPRLTDAQRRHIGVALDRLMRETRERLERPDQNVFGGFEEPTLRRALEGLLEEVERAADSLDVRLEQRAPDPYQELATWAITWWTRILDSRPNTLRAYGKVDEATAAAVGPVVERLATRLQDLKTLAESKRID